VNVAGCGFDAIVADRVNQSFRRLHGTTAFVAAILRELPAFRPARLRLTLDGETRDLRAVMVSVANAQSYGGGMRIAPNAQLDDGLFDVCIIGDAGRLEFLRVFPTVFRGAHVSHPKVSLVRARRVVVESDPPLPVLIDGEVVGATPVTFDLLPKAMAVMAPQP
jgi:diacylglycerol kinase (ATP)